MVGASAKKRAEPFSGFRLFWCAWSAHGLEMPPTHVLGAFALTPPLSHGARGLPLLDFSRPVGEG